MKRLFCILLSLCMLVGVLAACGKKDEADTADLTTPETLPAEQPANVSATPTLEELYATLYNATDNYYSKHTAASFEDLTVRSVSKVAEQRKVAVEYKENPADAETKKEERTQTANRTVTITFRTKTVDNTVSIEAAAQSVVVWNGFEVDPTTYALSEVSVRYETAETHTLFPSESNYFYTKVTSEKLDDAEPTTEKNYFQFGDLADYETAVAELIEKFHKDTMSDFFTDFGELAYFNGSELFSAEKNGNSLTITAKMPELSFDRYNETYYYATYNAAVTFTNDHADNIRQTANYKWPDGMAQTEFSVSVVNSSDLDTSAASGFGYGSTVWDSRWVPTPDASMYYDPYSAAIEKPTAIFSPVPAPVPAPTK